MYKSQIKCLVEYIDVSGGYSPLTGVTNCYAYQGYINFIKNSFDYIKSSECLNFAIRQSPIFILSELINKQERLQPTPPSANHYIQDSAQVLQCRQVIHEIQRVMNVIKRCIIKESFFQTPEGKYIIFTEKNSGLCIKKRALDVIHYAIKYYAKFGPEHYYNQLIILNLYREFKKGIIYFFDNENHELPVITPDLFLNPFHRFRLNGADVDFTHEKIYFDRQVCIKCLTIQPEGCCLNPRLINTDYAFIHENKCYLVPSESLSLSSDGKTAFLNLSSLTKYLVPFSMFIRQ